MKIFFFFIFLTNLVKIFISGFFLLNKIYYDSLLRETLVKKLFIDYYLLILINKCFFHTI